MSSQAIEGDKLFEIAPNTLRAAPNRLSETAGFSDAGGNSIGISDEVNIIY